MRGCSGNGAAAMAERDDPTDHSIAVLFCCMGNICRSPTAHGVFRQLVIEQGLAHRVLVDSAGTHAYHVGEPPDRRSQQAAATRGIDLSDLRARAAVAEDFERFDYVLAMDHDNLAALRRLRPAQCRAELRLFMEFAPHATLQEVPDPYYGGARGFEQVLDMVESAAHGLLQTVRERLAQTGT